MRKRRWITMLCNLLIFSIAILLLKITSNATFNYTGPLALVSFILILVVYDWLTKRFLLTTQEAGLIFFSHDFIQMEYSNHPSIYRLKYSSIAKIQYRKSVPKTVVWSNSNPFSIIVEFKTFDHRTISFEIENKLYLTEQDQLQFRSMEPNAIFMLQQINPKYGVEEDRDLKSPNNKPSANSEDAENGIVIL
jgi:hypothetical protein